MRSELELSELELSELELSELELSELELSELELSELELSELELSSSCDATPTWSSITELRWPAHPASEKSDVATASTTEPKRTFMIPPE
jgi:hypothetical protein